MLHEPQRRRGGSSEEWAHRDLKPENIMLDESDPKSGGTIKLIDFGFAQKLGREEDGADPFLHTACGTPQYVAPEIVPADIHETPSYGPPVDVWALGVITYILLCGYPPFYGDERAELARHSGG